MGGTHGPLIDTPQVIVLQRQTKRAELTWRDRALFVLLASKLRSWKRALIIVP